VHGVAGAVGEKDGRGGAVGLDPGRIAPFHVPRPPSPAPPDAPRDEGGDTSITFPAFSALAFANLALSASLDAWSFPATCSATLRS
jgi:hypothetical protein